MTVMISSHANKEIPIIIDRQKPYRYMNDCPTAYGVTVTRIDGIKRMQYTDLKEPRLQEL